GEWVAFSDMKAAAIVEDQAEIVIAAEGVAPWQPVDDDRRLIGNKCKTGADHGLISAHHAMGVGDTLRPPGRTRGEENFCRVIRLHAPMRLIDFPGGGRLQKRRK